MSQTLGSGARLAAVEELLRPAVDSQWNFFFEFIFGLKQLYYRTMKNCQVIPLEGVFFRLGHLGRGANDASHRTSLETTARRACTHPPTHGLLACLGQTYIYTSRKTKRKIEVPEKNLARKQAGKIEVARDFFLAEISSKTRRCVLSKTIRSPKNRGRGGR